MTVIYQDETRVVRMPYTLKKEKKKREKINKKHPKTITHVLKLAHDLLNKNRNKLKVSRKGKPQNVNSLCQCWGSKSCGQA